MKTKIQNSKAFTLTELLVVLAILAVSAVTLLAALNQTGGRGRTMQCLENMRRLAQATQMHVNDHNGFLPGGNYNYYLGNFFPISLARYLGVQMDERRALMYDDYLAAVCRTAPVFRCPSWPNQNMTVDYGLQYAWNNIDYTRLGPMYNSYQPVINTNGLKLSDVPFPLSDIALLLELYADPSSQVELPFGLMDVHNPKQATFNSIGTPNPPGNVRMIWAGDRRHDGYTTLSFMDSHVEVRALTKEELSFRIFNPKASQGPF